MNSEGIWNDIGVIVTQKPIPNVVPATISANIKSNTEIFTAGFGVRDGKAGRLWVGKSKVKDHNLYEFETYANGENGTCGGDSGGPAYYQNEKGEYVLSGILSRSYRDSNCGGYAYYTIPIMYVPWMEQVTAFVTPVE